MLPRRHADAARHAMLPLRCCRHYAPLVDADAHFFFLLPLFRHAAAMMLITRYAR